MGHQPAKHETQNPLAHNSEILLVSAGLDVFLAHRKHRRLLYLPVTGKLIFIAGVRFLPSKTIYLDMSLFATKSVSRILSESEGGAHQLKRTLGPAQLVALGIGAIIGAGLFSLTGIAASVNAGPAVVQFRLVAAIGCAFAGLCYSEFSTMIPIAGSAYTYAYATMGELMAWLIGWDLVLEYAVGASTVAVSWSRYVMSFFQDFGIHFPPHWRVALRAGDAAGSGR